jgi:hypothetical protein
MPVIFKPEMLSSRNTSHRLACHERDLNQNKSRRCSRASTSRRCEEFDSPLTHLFVHCWKELYGTGIMEREDGEVLDF